jgi:cold shock protein
MRTISRCRGEISCPSTSLRPYLHTFGHFCTRRLENGAGPKSLAGHENNSVAVSIRRLPPFPDYQDSDQAGACRVRVTKGKGPPPMRQNGVVKFFNSSKGFGFITPEGETKDVFVHASALEQAGISHLSDGQQVTFETEPDRHGKGPKAIDIQLA